MPSLSVSTYIYVIFDPFSGVIEYLERGRVGSDHVDFKDLKYKNTLTKMLQSSSSNSNQANEQYYAHGFKARSYHYLLGNRCNEQVRLTEKWHGNNFYLVSIWLICF